MTTTLSEGVKVPDVGSVNWAGDLEVNWNLLNGALANLSGNVKTDRDNTWTGEQSFTLPIVGSITGTASKAIADEDGTSIKTGYGKLAGSQTWSGINTYNDGIYTKTGFRAINDSYSSGTPSANIFYSALAYGGLVSNTFTRSFSIDGAIRTTGYNDLSLRVYSQTGEVLSGVLIESNATASDIAFRPIANGTHKLGSSSYQWSSVYAQTYYYNGTVWGLDKSNVWSGENTYTNTYLTQKHTGLEEGELPASTQTRRYRFTDKNNASLSWVQHRVNTSGESYIELYVVNKFDNSQLSTQGTVIATAFDIGLKGDGTRFASIMSDLYPAFTNTYNLGTSTNKWKTLNGVNPGALSFPDNSNAINLDTTNWGVSGELNHYAPTINGWLCISVKGGANNGLFLMDTSSGFGQSCYGNANETVAGRIKVALPVIASRDVLIIIHADSNSDIYEAKLYPCLGNV